MQITRRIEFDAGHRLLKHEGKCSNVHGHRYVVEVVLEASTLDKVGRVLDYATAKHLFGGWVDDKLDHGYIYEAGDPVGAVTVEQGLKAYCVPFPPTAEHLVAHLYEVFAHLLAQHNGQEGNTSADRTGIVRVRLYETPNCWADFPSYL